MNKNACRNAVGISVCQNKFRTENIYCNSRKSYRKVYRNSLYQSSLTCSLRTCAQILSMFFLLFGLGSFPSPSSLSPSSRFVCPPRIPHKSPPARYLCYVARFFHFFLPTISLKPHRQLPELVPLAHTPRSSLPPATRGMPSKTYSFSRPFLIVPIFPCNFAPRSH